GLVRTFPRHETAANSANRVIPFKLFRGIVMPKVNRISYRLFKELVRDKLMPSFAVIGSIRIKMS
ncbi:hypothetical protein, partial [Aeromonas caviae]|uniref:hypothetical protein n=1 Tax=Aeromonas caviae TaxID=648 RepID=UPI0029DB6FFE